MLRKEIFTIKAESCMPTVGGRRGHRQRRMRVSNEPIGWLTHSLATQLWERCRIAVCRESLDAQPLMKLKRHPSPASHKDRPGISTQSQ